MTDPPAPPLSVVVVTWESGEHLIRLVESMNEHLDPSAELVLVDNDSDVSPEAIAARWRGRLKVETLDSNRGFGTAVNHGVRIAAEEAVVLLNPDTVLLDSRLPSLAAFALRRRCIAGPRLLNADGSIQPSASGSPIGVWPWVGALIPGAVQPQALRRHTEPWRLKTEVEVAWLSGACLAAPRSLLVELGPFDESIEMYAEDLDLGLRAGRAGVESWFCPALCTVTHRGRGSTEQRWPDGPERVGAANRRRAIGAAAGPRAELWAWRAERVRLSLRLVAKRVLGRRVDRERRELRALRSAPAPRSRPGPTRRSS